MFFMLFHHLRSKTRWLINTKVNMSHLRKWGYQSAKYVYPRMRQGRVKIQSSIYMWTLQSLTDENKTVWKYCCHRSRPISVFLSLTAYLIQCLSLVFWVFFLSWTVIYILLALSLTSHFPTKSNQLMSQCSMFSCIFVWIEPLMELMTSLTIFLFFHIK